MFPEIDHTMPASEDDSDSMVQCSKEANIEAASNEHESGVESDLKTGSSAVELPQYPR